MEAKHTTGEWLVTSLFKLGIKVENVFGITAGKLIAIVNYHKNCKKEEAEANVKLIVASPKMLKALIRVRIELTDIQFERKNAVLFDVNEAIKKATE